MKKVKNPRTNKYLTRKQIMIKDILPGMCFYDYEGIIWVMLDNQYDENSPNRITYIVKQFKTHNIYTQSISCNNAINQVFYLYTGRDYSSFTAGFKAATALCMKHMDVFDLQNAGLDNSAQQHLTMSQIYNKWKYNQGIW